MTAFHCSYICTYKRLQNNIAAVIFEKAVFTKEWLPWTLNMIQSAEKVNFKCNRQQKGLNKLDYPANIPQIIFANNSSKKSS